MRYAADHKQRTRERLLRETARAIRRDGPHRVGVAAVMAKAGLTHGGFYAHFRSRDDMIAEGVAQLFRESRAKLAQTLETAPGPRAGVRAYIDFYLSAKHRDARTSGCPLPGLSGDAPRLPARIRARFAQGVQGIEDQLTAALAKLGRADPQDDAGSLLAELAGAMALARAEPDRARSDAMLQRSRQRLLERLALGEDP